MSEKEIVPVVVYHEHDNYSSRVYKYQVFTGEYCRKDHTIKNLSKDYSCFGMEEEVAAYCQGLERSGLTYKGKRKALK